MATDRSDYYRTWAAANKERLGANKQRWYRQHKIEQDARTQKWTEGHIEERKRIVKRYHDSHNVQQRVANGRARARQRGHAFAVTIEEVQRAQDVQCDLCTICGNAETRTQHGVVQALAIDHCHFSGRFRGLLCEACNKVLGFVEDSPGRLHKAIEYLQRFRHSDAPSEIYFDEHA